MKTATRKMLSIILSIAIIIGIVQSIGAIPVFAAGVSSVSIGISTLANGKYYTAKSDTTGDALLDEADVKPSGDTPYLYYNDGTLTVNGDISLTSNMPTLAISGGTLNIAGTGRLSIASNMAPTVIIGKNDTLMLTGSVGFGAYQWGNVPVFVNGNLKTADGYTGNIDIFSNGSDATTLFEMSEINLKTTGYINIKSAGSPMLIYSIGAVNLEGSSVRIANQGGGLIDASSTVSIKAANDNLELIGNYDGASLRGTDITLAAKDDITINSNKEKGYAVNGNFKITNASNVDIKSNGSFPTFIGNVDINASGDVKIANNQGERVMSGDSMAVTSTGGSITAFGSGNQYPVIDAKNLVKLEALGNVLIQRLNDIGCMIPVIPAGSKTLTSKNGLVIVSGSTGSSITTKDGKTLAATFGGNITNSGIDLNAITPTKATLYLAGDGYLLFNPASGTTPATLNLCNASIEVQDEDLELITLPKGEAINMQISGKNTLQGFGFDTALGITTNKNEQANLTITSSDNGTLDIKVSGNTSGAIGGGDSEISSLTIGGNATVTATAKSDAGMATGTTIEGGKLTVEPTAKFTSSGDFIDLMVFGEETSVKQAFDGTVAYVDAPISKVYINGAHNLPGVFKMANVGTTEQNGDTVTCYLNITSGSVLTIPIDDTLTINDLAMLKNDGSIINHGTIVLPDGKTVDDIKALKLTGNGAVIIDGKYYSNDSTAMTVVEANSDEGLTLTETPVTAADNKGYTWAKSGEGEAEEWTLTLNNTYINCSLILPDKNVVINTTSSSVISGELEGISQPLNVTFTGTAQIVINSGISGSGTNGDVVTVKDGAQVSVQNGIGLGASGGEDGTLNVIGKGSSLNVTALEGAAVHCDTVNVQNGAALTVTSQGEGSRGIQALSGGVSVTEGSTLTAGCDYGIYIIGGMLKVDDTSKLITNADVAPFCIVDYVDISGTTPLKTEAQVLKLPSIPEGTKINTANADDSNFKYALWSLTSTDGTLSVIGNPANEPANLVGAAKGSLTFAKAADNNGGGNGDGGNGGNGGNGDNGGNDDSSDDNNDNTNSNNTAASKATQPNTNTTTSKPNDNPNTGATSNVIIPVAIILIFCSIGMVFIIRRKINKI